MTNDNLVADYLARGGKVTRVASGKRNYSRAYMRAVVGDDDARAVADAAEDYRKARRVERRAARRAKAAARKVTL